MGRGLDRAVAKEAFEAKRRERDTAMAKGDEVGAWRAHEESSRIVRDFNRKKDGK